MTGSGLPNGWRSRPLTELAEISFSGVDKKSSPDELPVKLLNYVDVFHNHTIDNPKNGSWEVRI